MREQQTYTEIKAKSDEKLEEELDGIMKNTVSGTADFYLAELRHRSATKINTSMEKMTRQMRFMTTVILCATLLQLVLAFVSSREYWLALIEHIISASY